MSNRKYASQWIWLNDAGSTYYFRFKLIGAGRYRFNEVCVVLS